MKIFSFHKLNLDFFVELVDQCRGNRNFRSFKFVRLLSSPSLIANLSILLHFLREFFLCASFLFMFWSKILFKPKVVNWLSLSLFLARIIHFIIIIVFSSISESFLDHIFFLPTHVKCSFCLLEFYLANILSTFLYFLYLS